ncbi:hypothetical protein BDB00DRAFT_514016 [Zychaea mexicana]|uniref:uncharacterized protein n=1 Tax=Zychaea mexicana TaxID=64656 RepID=UPI0022FDED9D|nr:uncharacterized protein BDB00DRAFT_514016 [Zychaea mexicana]KAI9491108.1 hypothetical protein BDB00DRAFT_514016 [Zychaea mexicana]
MFVQLLERFNYYICRSNTPPFVQLKEVGLIFLCISKKETIDSFDDYKCHLYPYISLYLPPTIEALLPPSPSLPSPVAATSLTSALQPSSSSSSSDPPPSTSNTLPTTTILFFDDDEEDEWARLSAAEQAISEARRRFLESIDYYTSMLLERQRSVI